MMRPSFLILARQHPWWSVLALTLAALASWWWPSVGVPALAVLSAWLFWRWQQRPRVVPTQPGAVLAPTDGRVVRIDRVRDPYANREALRISLTSSWVDGPASRASVDGVVTAVQYHPGPMFHASLDPASPLHERNAVIIDSGGHTITLVQVAGWLARRILCHIRPGETLTRGQRYGLVRFGARLEVYLPISAVPRVAPGDRVVATTSILASLQSA
jgi:phosphatidylserine decarboxylase